MNRNALIKHVELHKAKLGSLSQVARKVGINIGALSTIMAGKYGANEEAMLQRIAKALDYRENSWQIVRTINNYRLIEAVVADARQESMWFAISNKAGSGKTGTLEDLYNRDTTGTVIFIQAEEWSGRQFLLKLIEKTQGEDAVKGSYKTISQLTDMVVNYFGDMSLNRPVLLIDEADKLKPSALRTLIPIYNRTEHRLGVVLSGTENFEKEIKAGVRFHKKGFDELESRFGRTYIHLKGASEKDVKAICQANGISDEEVQIAIWFELEKVEKQTTVQTTKGSKDVRVPYVEDFRRLMRLIKTKKLLKTAA